jgi:hypothetical protein
MNTVTPRRKRINYVNIQSTILGCPIYSGEVENIFTRELGPGRLLKLIIENVVFRDPLN